MTLCKHDIARYGGKKSGKLNPGNLSFKNMQSSWVLQDHAKKSESYS
jgi:hypothetical protein